VAAHHFPAAVSRLAPRPGYGLTRRTGPEGQCEAGAVRGKRREPLHLIPRYGSGKGKNPGVGHGQQVPGEPLAVEACGYQVVGRDDLRSAHDRVISGVCVDLDHLKQQKYLADLAIGEAQCCHDGQAGIVIAPGFGFMRQGLEVLLCQPCAHRGAADGRRLDPGRCRQVGVADRVGQRVSFGRDSGGLVGLRLGGCVLCDVGTRPRGCACLDGEGSDFPLHVGELRAESLLRRLIRVVEGHGTL
jgi:hypothetical protein